MTRLITCPGPGILLVANYSNRTGYAWNNIYRLFERIAVELRRSGIAPWVSFAQFQPPLEWEHADEFAGVLELPPRLRAIGALWPWVQAIRRHGIRYVYLTDQESTLWAYAIFRLAGVRAIVVHSRVSVPDPNPSEPSTGILGLLKWVARRVPFIQADRIYAVSDFVRNRLVLKARVPKGRVITILNGIDLERYQERARRIRSGPVRIFCGGRATTHKGVHVLIEAATLLRDRYGLGNFLVSYAGDGPDIESFRRLVEKHSIGTHFEFLGELPSTDDLLLEADIVAVPSIWGDACPSAVSEALASGKPLVATRVGGVPEIVGVTDAAMIVEPNDPLALAGALASLISSPEHREQLATAARQRAVAALDQRRYYATVITQLTRDLGLVLPSMEDAATNSPPNA